MDGKMIKFKEFLIKESSKSSWVFFPGGYKPPTIAHFKNVEKNLSKVSGPQGRFVILIGSEERDGITYKQSYQIWEELYKPLLSDNLEILTPELLKTDTNIKVKNPNMLNSPVGGLAEFAKTYCKAGDTIYLLVGKKDQDENRYKWFKTTFTNDTGVIVKEVIADNVEVDGKTASATELRDAIKYNDLDVVEKYLPEGVDIKKYMKIVQQRIKTIEKVTESEVMMYEDLFLETVGHAGLDYELKIYSAIKLAGIPELRIDKKPVAGFSNVGAGDIEATYKGKPFNIEAKSSTKDQMGGTSLRYNAVTKVFTPVSEDISEDNLEIILDSAKSKIPAIDAYLKAARKLEPVQFHKEIKGVPFKISKVGRNEMRDRGYLVKINNNVEADISFIVHHYNNKDVYYINIGGAGLFYMGKNPLHLPIPPLEGKILIEMRLGTSGTKSFFPTVPPTPARSASLRVQGRLLTTSKSPYSLDNIEDIRKLFGSK